MSAGNFITTGCAAAVRTSSGLRGGITGAMRIAHLADAFHLRAEVHGGGLVARHLCMAIKNNTYYEALVDSFPVRRPSEVDAQGMVRATSAPGNGWEEQWRESGLPADLAAAGISL
jgi:L-alanine-DL-glutamate epimerase-like enolase superfamily enzyme